MGLPGRETNGFFHLSWKGSRNTAACSAGTKITVDEDTRNTSAVGARRLSKPRTESAAGKETLRTWPIKTSTDGKNQENRLDTYLQCIKREWCPDPLKAWRRNYLTRRKSHDTTLPKTVLLSPTNPKVPEPQKVHRPTATLYFLPGGKRGRGGKKIGSGQLAVRSLSSSTREGAATKHWT